MEHYIVTASSRVGCVRTNNEDMVLVGEKLIRNHKMNFDFQVEDGGRMLFALADGMGGHNCGEVASEDVLKNLKYYFNDLPDNLTPNLFEEAMHGWLKSINQTIVSKGQSDPMYLNMGTTLVALVYYGGEYFWMNCGDSRVYRFHDGELKQLTTDHSLSNLLGRQGHSSQIVNCIGGGFKDSYLDIVMCTDLVQKGDIFLICSDGLTDMVDDNEVRRLVGAGFDANALCEAADDAGGRDNTSVILIEIK